MNFGMSFDHDIIPLLMLCMRSSLLLEMQVLGIALRKANAAYGIVASLKALPQLPLYSHPAARHSAQRPSPSSHRHCHPSPPADYSHHSAAAVSDLGSNSGSLVLESGQQG